MYSKSEILIYNQASVLLPYEQSPSIFLGRSGRERKLFRVPGDRDRFGQKNLGRPGKVQFWKHAQRIRFVFSDNQIVRLGSEHA